MADEEASLAPSASGPWSSAVQQILQKYSTAAKTILWQNVKQLYEGGRFLRNVGICLQTTRCHAKNDVNIHSKLKFHMNTFVTWFSGETCGRRDVLALRLPMTHIFNICCNMHSCCVLHFANAKQLLYLRLKEATVGSVAGKNKCPRVSSRNQKLRNTPTKSITHISSVKGDYRSSSLPTQLLQLYKGKAQRLWL